MPDPDLDEEDWSSDLPEMAEVDRRSVWWTWNMATAWVIFRSAGAVKKVESYGNAADGIAQALVNGEFVGLAAHQSYAQDGFERACSSLIEKIDAGRIKAVGRPMTGGLVEPAQAIEPQHAMGLVAVPDEQGHLQLDYRSLDDPMRAAVNLRVTGFAEPRLDATDVKKAFPQDGKSLERKREIERAIAFLIEHLKSDQEVRTKPEFEKLLSEEGITVTHNAFEKQVWPVVTTETGHNDLRKRGRRRNTGKPQN